MFSELIAGFSHVFQGANLLALMLGTVVGYFVGPMPGLTPSIGIALLVPFTFGMDPVMAMIMLVSLYMAAEYGGGITAILLNAPGTPAAVPTSFDGYPMTQRGDAGKALTLSIIASGLGAFTSSVLLIFTAVTMANAALAFGPAEYFALAVLGLSLVSSLSGKSLVKGFLSMFIGLLVVTIGLDPVNGTPRFAFTNEFFEGIPFLPALIGLFALSEVLFILEDADKKPVQLKDVRGIGVPLGLFKDMWVTILRSPIIGYLIGIIPGAGTTIASLISYNEAKRTSKKGKPFGEGNPEGIVASESANNAAVAGALAPLLALGIPGSASAAILIGALTIQGLQPGPLLFVKNAEIPYSIFASLLIAAPIMVLIGIGGVRLWMRVTLIPKKFLAVIVSGICFLGAYAHSNSMYPVWIMLISGLIGYGLRKVEIPTAPLVLSLVLGYMMEVNFRRLMMASEGNMLFFFSRPIALVLLAAAVFMLIVPIIQALRARHKTDKSDQQHNEGM